MTHQDGSCLCQDCPKPGTASLSIEAMCDSCPYAQMDLLLACNSSIQQDTGDLRRDSKHVNRIAQDQRQWEVPGVRTTTYSGPPGHQEQRRVFLTHCSIQVSQKYLGQEARGILVHLPSYHVSFIWDHIESLNCP